MNFFLTHKDRVFKRQHYGYNIYFPCLNFFFPQAFLHDPLSDYTQNFSYLSLHNIQLRKLKYEGQVWCNSLKNTALTEITQFYTTFISGLMYKQVILFCTRISICAMRENECLTIIILIHFIKKDSRATITWVLSCSTQSTALLMLGTATEESYVKSLFLQQLGKMPINIPWGLDLKFWKIKRQKGILKHPDFTWFYHHFPLTGGVYVYLYR